MNVPRSIQEKIPRKLHLLTNHPIEIVKRKIYDYFMSLTDYKFQMFDDLNPIVSVEDNFDKLLIPTDHPSRSKSDTYYVADKYVLRTHTSAHQNSLLEEGVTSFLVCGDVYRKDEIDARHYPIFHQMEMVTVIAADLDPVAELKKILSGLMTYLFPDCQYRFNDDYFPFTSPSFEVEVKFLDKWLEILGCGVVQPQILHNNGIYGKTAIAAGLGLDRLCMIFSDIPDIRYLWSTNDKFLQQFSDGTLKKFVPYCDLPPITKDISFWIPKSRLITQTEKFGWLEENDFFEIVREIGGELIESVTLFDEFYNDKKDKYSRSYRITYSSNDPDLHNPAEFSGLVNETHLKIYKIIPDKNLQIELR